MKTAAKLIKNVQDPPEANRSQAEAHRDPPHSQRTFAASFAASGPMGCSRSASNRRMWWNCSYEDAGVKLQDCLCHWLARQHEEEVTDWFSAWWCWPKWPVKGRWLLGNGGPRSKRRNVASPSRRTHRRRTHRRWVRRNGLVANKEGMEASWRWDSSAISMQFKGAQKSRPLWINLQRTQI